MAILKLKACPRCKSGDVAFDRDYHGWYEYCIQCGYMRDLSGIVELDQPQACGVKGRKKSYGCRQREVAIDE